MHDLVLGWEIVDENMTNFVIDGCDNIRQQRCYVNIDCKMKIVSHLGTSIDFLSYIIFLAKTIKLCMGIILDACMIFL